MITVATIHKLTEEELKKIFYKKFNHIIRFIDPALEKSSKEIASEIGISQQSYSDYSCGRKLPSMLNYIKIVHFITKYISDFEEDYLLGITDNITKR